MALFQSDDRPVLQECESIDHTPLAGLPTQICSETGQRYILWTDVKQIFNGVDHLQRQNKDIVLFLIDNNGKLYRPFRMEYNPNDVYRVICHDSSDYQDQGNNSNHSVCDHLMYLKNRGALCKRLYERLESSIEGERHAFQQLAANAQYHHSTLVQELAGNRRNGSRLMVEGAALGSIMKELQVCGQKQPEHEYRNNCHHLHYEVERRWDYPISNLFIAIPSDLTSWDDEKPSTHQFRIYFLCGNWKKQGKIPHAHLSNHHGFGLKHPKEFFQIYGDQVLQVLQMIKRGGFGNGYRVPSLDTFDILRGCDAEITGKPLSKENIGIYVDKAIAYLQHIFPPKQLNIKMDRTRSAAIKTYLDIQDGDRAEGNLYRSMSSGGDVFWFCPAHAHHLSNREAMEELTNFVRNHGGHVDMQLSTLGVELGSTGDADQFFSVLKRAGRDFNISMNLKKATARASLEKFCFALAKTGAKVLTIDGITLDSHPQDYVQHRTSLFSDLVSRPNTHRLKLVTVLNYPRPQEHSVYTAGCSLHSKFIPVQSWYDWVGMRNELEQFRKAVYGLRNAAEYNAPARRLRSALAAYGLKDVTEVTIYTEETKYRQPWNATFDLVEGTLVHVYSSDLGGPPTLTSSVSLKSLAQDFSDACLDQELYRIVQTNSCLQEFTLSTLGHDVLRQVEPIIQMWRTAPRPFILTLFDRTLIKGGRVVAQVAIKKHVKNGTGPTRIEVQKAKGQTLNIQREEQNTLEDLAYLEWECDHLFFRFSDLFASFLDRATEQFSSVLTSITLDISSLSEIGLACIGRVLARSDIEYLCILCGSFQPGLSAFIAQVLQSISWHSLKTLVLTGENIEEWLRLWPSAFTPQLFSLHIQGAGSSLSELSHASVLTIHQMIYMSPLEEIHLESVTLLDEQDWPLIVESTDMPLPKNV